MDVNRYAMIFGRNIYRLRKENRLTQKQMADRLGIGTYSLSKLEKGIMPKRMSCTIIFTVCAEFGTVPENLFSV